MKVVFVGDMRDNADNPPSITMMARFTGNRYDFELNGPGVEVKKADEDYFKGHSHFVISEEDHVNKKKKASKVSKARAKEKANEDAIKRQQQGK